MFRISVAALSLCACDLGLDIDVVGSGEFKLDDDGTTLFATACPVETLFRCSGGATLKADGATVPIESSPPMALSLFDRSSYEVAVPSPVSRTVTLTWPDGEVDVPLTPDFPLELSIPTRRSELLLIETQPWSSMTTVQLATTCEGGGTIGTVLDMNAHLEIRLEGEGTCEHILLVYRSQLIEDQGLVESRRIVRNVFTTLP